MHVAGVFGIRAKLLLEYRERAFASPGRIYVTSSDDAVDALAANPAGLTSLTGRTLDASVSLVLPRGSFSNSVNNSAPMSQTPGAIPYGAFAMPIRHSRFSFGVGFVPDLASVSD